MLQRLSGTLREIHRQSREAPAATFQADVFEVLKSMIRFDTGFWGGGRGPIEAVVMHYIYLHRLPAEQMNADFEKAKFHPKMIEAMSQHVSEMGRANAIDVREAGVDFFYGAYGVDQLVTLYLHNADLGLYHVLSLYRSGKERFSEQECLLFESVVPHLLDAYQENRLLHLSGGSRDVCPLTPAAALVDWEGVVHFARPAFVELLRHEWPEWRGPYLPEEMRRLKDESFTGNKIAVRFTPQSDSLYLVVMRKTGPLDQLTARELEVAKQVAQGASYKGIAVNLSISPATARNHIARIHSKLGTNKGTQVATLLLSEGML